MANLESIRNSVLEAYYALGATITKANGYNEDIGLKIYRPFEGPSPVNVYAPSLAFAVGTSEPREDAIGIYERTLDVAVCACINTTSRPDLEKFANAILADMQEVMGRRFSATIPTQATPSPKAVPIDVTETRAVIFPINGVTGKLFIQLNYDLDMKTSRDSARVL